MPSDHSELCAQRTDLVRYVGRNVDNPALREDIVQEAYLRLLTYQAKPGSAVANVEAFLRRIALNLTRDYFRRAGRGMTIALSEDIACPRSDLAAQTERRQLIEIVSDILGKMPRLRREVFISRRLRGHSAREVGDLMGITPGAVDAHVARAVLDLHHALEKLEKRGAPVKG